MRDVSGTARQEQAPAFLKRLSDDAPVAADTFRPALAGRARALGSAPASGAAGRALAARHERPMMPIVGFSAGAR